MGNGRGFLSERDVHATEEMDSRDCDPVRLEKTYARFGAVNTVVSRWRQVYRQRLRPLLAPAGGGTLLDIGCGGGDVDRSLARWAARDGLDLQITGIDPDPRALAFARGRPPLAGLSYREVVSSELVAEGKTFDVVISNHILHHLTPDQLQGVMADSEQLARRLVIHCDLVRSPAAYALFSAGAWPFFHGSLIRGDGLTSIRRSYTTAELQAVARPGWSVERAAPYRNLLIHVPAGTDSAATGNGPPSPQSHG